MTLDFIMDYESGEVEDVLIIENFAEGIADGSVWQLQGHYGRTAQSLIDSGYISSKGEILIDFDEL